MSLLLLSIIVFVLGLLGGFLNAATSDNLFLLPKKVENGKIYRLGCIVTVLIGGIAAFLSWGLYGPYATAYIISGPQSSSGSTAQEFGLTLSAIAGAILVGFAGTKWLTNEVDKKLQNATISKLAPRALKQDEANKIASAKPMEALKIAKEGLKGD